LAVLQYCCNLHIQKNYRLLSYWLIMSKIGGHFGFLSSVTHMGEGIIVHSDQKCYSDTNHQENTKKETFASTWTDWRSRHPTIRSYNVLTHHTTKCFKFGQKYNTSSSTKYPILWFFIFKALLFLLLCHTRRVVPRDRLKGDL